MGNFDSDITANNTSKSKQNVHWARGLINPPDLGGEEEMKDANKMVN